MDEMKRRTQQTRPFIAGEGSLAKRLEPECVVCVCGTHAACGGITAVLCHAFQ